MDRTLVLKRTFEPNKMDRATFCPTGDWHIGAKTCDEDAIMERIDFCLRKKIYLLGLGDYMEACLKDSKGDLFEQRVTPEAQMEKVISMLQPLADKGLLLGLLRGNHETRISRATSIDVTRLIAKVLKVPYLDISCFAIFTVGKQKYTVHAQHGSSGARLPYTKIKAVLDLWRFNEAELVLMGHLHSLDHATQLYQRVDRRTGRLIEATRHACICGSYLRYRGSYAESMSLPPVQIGSPLVYLYGDEHKIHVNI